MKRSAAALALGMGILLGCVAAAQAKSQIGMASYYKMGTRTASGERYNPNGLTAAHPNLPFGTRVLVTNLENGKSVIVRINDRGPFTHKRVMDLSFGAAKVVGLTAAGVGKIKYTVLELTLLSP